LALAGSWFQGVGAAANCCGGVGGWPAQLPPCAGWYCWPGWPAAGGGAAGGEACVGWCPVRLEVAIDRRGVQRLARLFEPYEACSPVLTCDFDRTPARATAWVNCSRERRQGAFGAALDLGVAVSPRNIKCSVQHVLCARAVVALSPSQ
jgi:hypothetical protein